MKLSLSTVLLSLPVGCQAYLPSLSHSRTTRAAFAAPSTSQVDSSQSSSDAAFSAFADTLDEESPLDSTVSKNPSQQQQQQQGGMDNNSKNNKPWQAKLEDLLDPKTNLAERQILLSELLDSNDQIRESVMDALANRKIDPLLTPTAAKLQDGTRAVVRQIANDILPQLSKSANRQRSGSANNNNNNNSPLPSLPMMPFAPPSPASLEKMAGRVLDLMSNQLQTTAKEFQEDLTDPLNKIPQRLTKQTGDLVKEARNIFLETPEGLAEPPYQVVESCDLYEVRDYEGYTVASTAAAMTKGDTGIEDMATAGTSFNALAAYLFGENADNKAMAMTTPVTTTNLGEMRFYLAEPQIPLPLNNNNNNNGDVAGESTASMEGDNAATSSVKIVDVPAARLAVRKFTGFATDGEVARQKDTLLQALAMDGIELDVDHGAVVPYVVFQYNPPYTLPMVRRNEVAVPVRSPEAIATKSSLKEEWSVDDNIIEDEEDVSPSDA